VRGTLICTWLYYNLQQDSLGLIGLHLSEKYKLNFDVLIEGFFLEKLVTFM
jgi:hypothetical protein